MNRYALNSAVPTAFGTCEYEPLNRTAAREWREAGPVVATIGYEETRIAMERVLGIPRPADGRFSRRRQGSRNRGRATQSHGFRGRLAVEPEPARPGMVRPGFAASES